MVGVTRIKRMLAQILCLASLIMTIIGILLPNLPSLPFAVLTVVLAIYSSEKLYVSLMNNPLIGGTLRTWKETRTMHIGTKIILCVFIWALLGMLAIFVFKRIKFKAALIGAALIISAFVVTRRNYDRLYQD